MKLLTSVLCGHFMLLEDAVEQITQEVSWDSLLRHQESSSPGISKEKQCKLDWIALFVGTALLNACHRLAQQLGDAESPISVAQGLEPDLSPQTHFYTGRYVQSLFAHALLSGQYSVVFSCWAIFRKAPIQGLCQHLSKLRYPLRSALARLPQRVGGRESYLERGKPPPLLFVLLRGYFPPLSPSSSWQLDW